jgi:hypothetical protein
MIAICMAAVEHEALISKAFAGVSVAAKWLALVLML